MLVNFCDTCLRTDVTCSTVSTEGYEVSNLVNNCDKGFLAYSCIKPPITIDFVFICNIQISHVIIWPQVGAQKSCGFQLSVKSSDTKNQLFTDVSTAFIQKEESGVLFYRRDISHHTQIHKPQNFAERYIKAINITNYVGVLRFSILKTENSVPALGKIEIWGRVSPKCGKDIAMNVMALWTNQYINLSTYNTSTTATTTSATTATATATATTTLEEKTREKRQREQVNDLLNVPEDFLDPITLEIMTQPIILPSGKIIDQKTLEKHGYNEAVWGRPVSDPFTGIPFSDIRKPIAALPLKARIDKFLLENSNEEEIKKLPRVLGTKVIQNCKNVEVITCISASSVNNINTVKSNSHQLKRALPVEATSSYAKKSFHGHSLPIAPLRNSNNSTRTSAKATANSDIWIRETVNKEQLHKRNVAIEERLNSSIQAINMPTCKCCSDKLFYKLPCEHIICRKALLSLDKNQCTICKLEFKSSEPQRFHLCN